MTFELSSKIIRRLLEKGTFSICASWICRPQAAGKVKED
jgi:hypothetical protein